MRKSLAVRRPTAAKLLAAVILATIASTASGAAPHRWQSLEVEGGTQLEYALVLPEGFDPSRAYPTLLALPPGPQTRQRVEAGLARYWGF